MFLSSPLKSVHKKQFDVNTKSWSVSHARNGGNNVIEGNDRGQLNIMLNMCEVNQVVTRQTEYLSPMFNGYSQLAFLRAGVNIVDRLLLLQRVNISSRLQTNTIYKFSLGLFWC